jgi:hypothetical protein
MPAHPFLMATRQQLASAVARGQASAEGQAALAELLRRARRGAELELPAFDHEWSRDTSRDDWRDIYPQVYRDTALIPRQPARACRDLALAWRLGLDDTLLSPAQRILSHFANHFQFDIEHWDVGMNYAGWGMDLLAAYDLAFDAVSGHERGRADAFFARMETAIETNDRLWVETNPGGRHNNHYTWHKWAIAWLGLFYERREWVEYAIHGAMGIAEVMENALMDDGFWFESSTCYHFTPLYALVPLGHALRNAGHELDLFTHVFGNGRSLRDMFTAPIEMALPDLTLPAVGDCYGHRVRLPDVMWYADAASVYTEPAFLWLRQQRGQSAMSVEELIHPPVAGPSEAPEARSRTWPEHGYVILREVEGSRYWGSDSWVAFLSFDRSSVHANADRMSLTLFGKGKLLAGNAEAISPGHSFSSPVQRELNRTTLAKNAVMVDRGSQRHTPDILRLSEFRADEGRKLATIDDDGALCEGVRQRRTVVLAAEYALDVFWVYSGDPHEYAWLLHLPAEAGPAEISVPLEAQPLWPAEREFAWLRNAHSGAAKTAWSAEWGVGEVRFRATFAGERGTRIVIADFPRTQEHEPPSIPMLAAVRNTASTAFVVLYLAGRAPLPEASVRVAETTAAALFVEVDIEGTTNQHELSPLAGMDST